MSYLSRPTTGEYYCLHLKARSEADNTNSNAEEMLNEEGKPKTSHTTNKVPFVMANAPKNFSLKKTDGVLGDVAPTVLNVMGLQQPGDMDGHSLLVKS